MKKKWVKLSELQEAMNKKVEIPKLKPIKRKVRKLDISQFKD